MWNIYGRPDERTEHERYLKAELEREREDRERDQRRAEEERQARREEMQARIEEAERTATTWPEALRKQNMLFSREANLWAKDIAQYGSEFGADDFFAPGVKACERALEIWKETEPDYQSKIDELLAQIETLKGEIRKQVAARLKDESDGTPGWYHIAQAIQNDENLNDWLNW